MKLSKIVTKCILIINVLMVSYRDGIMGELSEDGEPKGQETAKIGNEKVGQADRLQSEEEQQRDGSHTPSLQQLDRPEGWNIFDLMED